MSLGFGTLPARRRPVRVITAVYLPQTREQRRLLARNAGHFGRLVAIGVALVIAAYAVFTGGGSSNAQASTATTVDVPQAHVAPAAGTRAAAGAYLIDLTSEGRA